MGATEIRIEGEEGRRKSQCEKEYWGGNERGGGHREGEREGRTDRGRNTEMDGGGGERKRE